MALPAGFVYLEDIDPSIIQEMKYSTIHNFMGRPIQGYDNSKCILTRDAANALMKLQKELLAQSLSLKVFDCYRPQAAVNDIINWSQDGHDQKMKMSYYPNVNKKDFFDLGYLAKRSGHTRGSTVDVTIVHLLSGDPGKAREMNMGTHFDFMDELSYTFNTHVTGQSRQNRLFLREAMQQSGFDPYDQEWWHFTLAHEPYPDTYFNFPVK
ncbi:MAG: M15 family metallopeptidase [Gammaproteobacteria bacterium]|nr:M15 family metallopeptidase [Gammaproteobacteria bacterium]